MDLLTLGILISEKSLKDGKKPSKVAEDLAEHLGITVPDLHKLKRAKGNLRISLERLIILSQYFDVTIDELINPAYKDYIASELQISHL